MFGDLTNKGMFSSDACVGARSGLQEENFVLEDPETSRSISASKPTLMIGSDNAVFVQLWEVCLSQLCGERKEKRSFGKMYRFRKVLSA